ncbi:hypothetical protein MRX96_026500 [Rhipicephalus microplus]
MLDRTGRARIAPRNLEKQLSSERRYRVIVILRRRKVAAGKLGYRRELDNTERCNCALATPRCVLRTITKCHQMDDCVAYHQKNSSNTF